MSDLVRVNGVSYGVKIETDEGKNLLEMLLRNPNIRFFSKISRNGVSYNLEYISSNKRVTLYSNGDPQKAFNFDNLSKYPWSRNV